MMVEIDEGASSILMDSGLCFGRVTGLKGEGEMRSEENGRVLRVPWVG